MKAQLKAKRSQITSLVKLKWRLSFWLTRDSRIRPFSRRTKVKLTLRGNLERICRLITVLRLLIIHLSASMKRTVTPLCRKRKKVLLMSRIKPKKSLKNSLFLARGMWDPNLFSIQRLNTVKRGLKIWIRVLWKGMRNASFLLIILSKM